MFGFVLIVLTNSSLFSKEADSLLQLEYLWKKSAQAIEQDDSSMFYRYYGLAKKTRIRMKPEENFYFQLIEANRLYFTYKLDSAFAQYQKTLAYLEDHQKWTELENALFLLANILEKKANYSLALDYLFKAQKVSERFPGVLHQNFCSIGYMYQQLGLYNDAEIYYHKCVNYRLKYKKFDKIFRAYGNLQYLYQITGRFDEELEIINTKLVLSQQLNNSAELADALYSKANYYSFLRDTAAISLYYRALMVADSIDHSEIKAIILNALGDVYVEKNICTKAMEFYQKSLDIALKNRHLIIAAYNEIDLALCQIKMGDFAKSEQHIFRTIDYNKQNRYDQQKTYIYKTYAELLNLARNYGAALEMANVAYQNLHQYKQWILFPELINEMIYSTINLKNASYTKLLLLRLDSFVALNPSEQYRLHWAEANYQVAKSQYDYKKALRMLELKESIRKKLYTNEYNLNAAKFDAVYQLEKSEHEKNMLLMQQLSNERKIRMQHIFLTILVFVGIILIVLMILMHLSFSKLKKHSAIIEEKNVKITEMYQTQSLIFRIIGHDLRGPMGNFGQFISMLIKFQEQKRFADLSNGLKMIHKQSNAIYLTLSNLLYWSANQSQRIEFKPKAGAILKPVKNVINFLQGSIADKNIVVEMDINDAQTAYFDESLMELIFRNLLSNAVKFSNEHTRITIKGIPQEFFLYLEVKDQGVGISPERLQKILQQAAIDSTYGTNAEKGTGLGLRISMDFLHLHGSSLQIKSEVGVGSVFSFLLPLSSINE